MTSDDEASMMNIATSQQSRTSLTQRLGSLFSKTETQSSAVASSSKEATPGEPMTTPRIPFFRQLSAASSARIPTVRWFDRRSSIDQGEELEVEDNTASSSEMEALQQAINEQLPIRPPPARIRPSPSSSHYPFGSSRSLKPPLMNSLARSTMPSYAASGVEATSNLRPLWASSTRRDSLESLKRLSSRDIPPPMSPTEPDPLSKFVQSWMQWSIKPQVDALLEEEDRGETVQEEREQIRGKYLSPRNPLVFCHGLLGFDSIQLGASFAPLQVSHWRGITEALEANGVEVLITRVPATSSIADRAKVLLEKVSEVYSGREIHLIGHSMGGLDCRYLTTHLEKPFKVLSITTIATPHRGSAFADHFLQTIGRDRLPSVVSLLEMLPNGGGDGRAFELLTRESMRNFNEETPDVPEVKYFSWGATYEPGLIDTWRWPHSVVLEKEGPNDGLVSVESSKWGTYLGTLENVSHLDLVGWINTARYKWAEFTGKGIRFKPGTFYLGIADHLARSVEGQAPGRDAVIGNEEVEGVDTSPAEQRNQQEQAEESEAQGGASTSRTSLNNSDYRL